MGDDPDHGPVQSTRDEQHETRNLMASECEFQKWPYQWIEVNDVSFTALPAACGHGNCDCNYSDANSHFSERDPPFRCRLPRRVFERLRRLPLHNVMPISGRAGTAPALEPQEAYPPARSTALAGYATRRTAISAALAATTTTCSSSSACWSTTLDRQSTRAETAGHRALPPRTLRWTRGASRRATVAKNGGD